MAEQRVNVAGVDAGGNVNIAPVQVNVGGPPSSTRGWTEALLRGPLERAGVTARAERGQSLRDEGAHAGAAAELEAVAQALTDAGYEPAAEAYLQRAAAAHADAGDRAAARARYMQLARATIGDGSLDAQMHARRARELSRSDEAWEAEALLARAAWPERVPGDVKALRAAWERTRGSDAEIEWAAALVELLVLADDLDQAREVAAAARSEHPLAPSDRLALELDHLDLLDQDAADDAWSGVADWAADPRLPIQAAGTAWQRRGVALARRGDPDAAHAAFLQAVQQWAREPGFDDQAAEAYFSGLSSHLAAGNLLPASDEGRSLARALRGSEQTATSRTERLLRRGLRALVNDRFPDAFRLLSVAMATARRAGNLSDFFEATEALGDCLAATGKHGGMALQAYRLAGVPDKAKRVVEGASVDDILEIVSLDGAGWERRAAWAAVAGCNRAISDDAAARVADAALAEEHCESARAFQTNASYYALEALGWIVCAVPERLRGEVLDLLRVRMQVGMGDPKHLADPLLMVTVTGLADESDALVGALLDDTVRVALRGAQLGEILEEHPDQRERLAAAARDGHGGALEALMFADAVEGDQQLIDRASARVRAATAAQVREVKEENGIRTVSYGIGGSLAPEGLMARFCEPADREAFVDKLLDTLGEDDLPLMSRVGAVEALHHLAPALPADRVDAVADTLARLAVSDDRPADVDRLDPDEPLARFKINMAPDHALRGGAIEALAVLGSHHPYTVERLRPSIAPALGSGAEPLVLAALHALARHPGLAPTGLDIGPLVLAPWPSVRVGALSVLVNHQPDAGAQAAAMLVGDPDEYVRRQLLHASASLDSGQEILEVLARDGDCFVRAAARALLEDVAG